MRGRDLWREAGHAMECPRPLSSLCSYLYALFPLFPAIFRYFPVSRGQTESFPISFSLPIPKNWDRVEWLSINTQSKHNGSTRMMDANNNSSSKAEKKISFSGNCFQGGHKSCRFPRQTTVGVQCAEDKRILETSLIDCISHSSVNEPDL